MSFQADYFDGLSAIEKPVLVNVDTSGSANINFEVAGVSVKFGLHAIALQAKLGSTKRVIELPDGGRLEALNMAELESAMPSKSNALWMALYYLENHLGLVLVCLALTVLAGWLTLQFGVPKLAEHVAKATPPSIEKNLGEQALKGLDSTIGYFSVSKTDSTHQAKIALALNKLCATLKSCPHHRLEFRASKTIGANAFALPGGIMVVTDGLVALSANDTEVIAVLAHELGHVSQRHAFRQSIQGMLSGLILAAATGDVSSLASGLPAVLIEMHYSRGHETEADLFALDAMQKACLPPKAFADILERLEHQPEAKEGGNQDVKTSRPKDAHSVNEMLSSHPDMQARIKPFLVAKQDCGQKPQSKN